MAECHEAKNSQVYPNKYKFRVIKGSGIEIFVRQGNARSLKLCSFLGIQGLPYKYDLTPCVMKNDKRKSFGQVLEHAHIWAYMHICLSVTSPISQTKIFRILNRL